MERLGNSKFIGRVAAAAAAGMLAVVLISSAAAQTEEDEAAAAYMDAVGGLEGRAAVLVTEVEAVNASWDNREVTFDEALAEMSRIESETAAIGTELAALTPPEDLVGQHEVMVETVARMSTAAANMISGMRGTDTGEARQAAAIEYLAAAADFADLALLVRGGPGDTTTTTTTTQPAETTSTSAAPTTTTTVAATTTATAAPVVAQPEPEPEGDGSGAPWVLLPVVMIVGILLGLVAGLLIGRRARFELIETIRRLRQGERAPPADPPTDPPAG